MNKVAARMTMQIFAESVATHLPGAWSVEVFPEDWGRLGAWLRCADNQAILTLGESQEYADRNKNLLSVGTDYPRDRDGHQAGERRPRIKVSASKTAAQVARDVERRILPEYLPLLEQVTRTQRARDAHEDGATRVAREIAAMVKVKVAPDESTVSFYHSPYVIFQSSMSEAKVLGEDEVELSLRLPTDVAKRVLDFVIRLPVGDKRL